MNEQVRPMPGDAVRLVSLRRRGLLDTGEIGVIGGMVGKYPDDGHSSITFRPSTYRDDRVVRVSGGPGTITTDLTELTPTNETVTLRCWRFKHDHAAKDNGYEYDIEVPVWEWSPSY